MEANNIQSLQPLNLYVSNIINGIPNTTLIKVLPKEPVVKNKVIAINNEITDPNAFISESEYVTNYIRFSDNSILDDSEIIRSEIAELFNISIPKVSRVFTEQNIPGIITEVNLKKETQLFTFTAIFSDINEKLQKGVFSKENYPEYCIQPNNGDTPITDLNRIEMIINKGKKEFPNDTFDKESEKEAKRYIHMILLDLMLGQQRRSDKYYYLSQTVDMRVGLKKELIPGICNYDFLSPVLKEDEYELNGFIIDRTSLLSVLLTRYSDYIKSIVSPLASVSARYKACISKIIYNNTSKENAAYLENMIFENIDKICTCFQQIPNHSNKVEGAHITAQLNLTIAQKEDELNAKYPINPRDNILEEEHEEIKITTGEENSSLKPNGYTTAALLSGLITLICIAGIIIAYVLTHR